MPGRFATDAKCHQRLERLRWPQGPRCPNCRSRRITKFAGWGKTGKRRRLYTCRSCHYQYTVTAGTFMHDSHVPLRKWFAAIFALGSALDRPAPGPGRPPQVEGRVRRRPRVRWWRARWRRAGRDISVYGARGPSPDSAGPGRPKKRVTALLLQKELRLGSYETAWRLVRRLRRAHKRGDRLLSKIAALARRHRAPRRRGRQHPPRRRAKRR